MNNSTRMKGFQWSEDTITLCASISSCGILLNSLLIVAFLKDPLKVLRTPSGMFILNIASIDFTASCTFLLAASLRSSVFCYFTKKTIWSLDGVTDFLSAFFITLPFASYLCLAVERFCSIALPLWHRVHVTTRVCRYWILAVWLFSFIQEGMIMTFQTFLYDNFAKSTLARLALAWTTFLCSLVFYFASYISIQRQRRKLESREDTRSAKASKIRLQNEQNFLVTISIVCSMLFLSFIPYAIMIAIYIPVLDNPEGADQDKYPSVKWGIFTITTNFAINPIVYLWRLPKYRKTFKKLYCKR